MRAALLALTFLATPLIAQDTSGLRADLSRLQAELDSLRADLATQQVGEIGGTVLDRVTLIEGELARLTGRVEQLGFRVDQVVRDGTNRLGDLEFRVCEVEPDCDIATLGRTAPLGGEVGEAPAAPVPAPQAPGPQLAVGEEGDARRAQDALASGDFQSAATLFRVFTETYPGSPLEPRAILGLGQALEGMGDTREAARAYLRVYTDYPGADAAPEALNRLGQSLGQLGKVQEACITLAEVANRYPASDQVDPSQVAMQSLGCS